MLQRISILALIVFSVFTLAAVVPAQTVAMTAQTTAVPTIGLPTVVSTVIVPVTGSDQTGLPLPTIVIIGLLIVLGFAIIVGGMAASRGSHDVHHDH